ncbi:MAG: nicotinate-nucleotide adenylyltransferase [Frankiaceae bacterium]|jgi:nicotinate-nucleotide adenylyltransferase|nr:nicotinate-nucleotide adenylyltransferase [Frankiaceae bacterium]
MAARRVGVMGGTFDPIHVGHLAAASEVAYRLALDEVVFVPTGLPWQKATAAVSPGEDRYAMTVLATEGDARFSVSRSEIDRPGVTYTVDTLTELAAGGDELFFIVGADALAGLPTWHEPARIMDLAHLVGVTRPGHLVDVAAFPPGSVTLVDVPALDVSGSDCRSRVGRGAPITYLVPQPVVDYIATHGLYAGSA